MSFTPHYLAKIAEVATLLDPVIIDRAVHILRATRENGGRLFIVGSGGGAGHASHAVCDFRKLAAIEAYAPTDNVSELTARINDDGWESSLANSLKVSKIRVHDTLLIFSVGGGNEIKNISVNLVNAAKTAKENGASVIAIVGRDGGYAAQVGDATIIIPIVDADLVTPITESYQAVVWHLLVSHPDLQASTAKWESTEERLKS